jgi:GTP-binding protein Era
VFQSAFVAILGSPNVGKSTLLNAFVGEKIAIVSKKAQTTRNRITGILTTGKRQFVFLDTPGIHTPKNRLGEYMVQTAKGAAGDVDVILFVADAKTGLRERDQSILADLPDGIPMIIAVNKIDAVDAARADEVAQSAEAYGCPVHRVSAAQGTGVGALLEALSAYLREGPMFYPDDIATDQPRQLIAAELIREKALKHIGKEIPHGIGVDIEKFTYDAQKRIWRIDAVLYVERNSHKGIVIGAGGHMLKKIASAARTDMEEMLGEQVFLQTWVKVSPDWRNKNTVLRRLGYE